jgi:aryl-alcohol dehydrogenase-like predicted oxidoreductase
MLKKEADREWLFQEQLRRTGAGYFDYYWLHDVNSQSVKNFDRLRCWDFIREKKEQGLVRHIGFSYHDGPELLDELLTAGLAGFWSGPAFDACQAESRDNREIMLEAIGRFRSMLEECSGTESGPATLPADILF